MEQQQQQIEANSSILANHNMKFEKDVIPEFIGRYLSDYEPKNVDKRDGTKSKPRKPSYFSDLDNRHYLNLLVCSNNKKISNRISISDSRNAFIQQSLSRVCRNLYSDSYHQGVYIFSSLF
jgi:hypothetical protein